MSSLLIQSEQLKLKSQRFTHRMRFTRQFNSNSAGHFHHDMPSYVLFSPLHLQAFCCRATVPPYQRRWSRVELRLMLICHRFAETAWQRLPPHSIFQQVQQRRLQHFLPSIRHFCRLHIRYIHNVVSILVLFCTFICFTLIKLNLELCTG